MYEVQLSRSANRYYQRADVDTARRLDRCFAELSRNPFRVRNVRPIRGRTGLFRYRVVQIRVLFSVIPQDHIVQVVAIGPRGDIY